MTVFGIDSSGRVAGVCVLRDGEVLWRRALNQGLTHSETLLPLVEEAFAAARLTPAGVDAYGVSAGPGSFTGLRIGLSLVKGLCLPFGTRVAPVSTLYALVLGSGLKGSVAVALNARRGEVYWAAFACGPGGCERLTPDAAEPAAAMAPTVQALPAPLYVIGDGAELVLAACKGGTLPNVPPGAGVEGGACGAAKAALLAAAQGGLLPASTVRPEYLRLSQAERERAAKLENSER